MRLDYTLVGSGWAIVVLEVADDHIELNASYIHDSLSDLADAARAIAQGQDEATAIFMDEPGEHRLELRRAPNDRVLVEVRWFSDYATGTRRSDPGELVFSAATRAAHIRGQVLSALRRVLDEHGVDGYRKLWKNHDFPIELYEALVATKSQTRKGD